ncbi:transcriptional regulator, PadR family [Clostridium cavendishii DSM 21758]|uniref:Transcriptional regulator, PadR family n=1 Tax=Clostridium cavendishii DSM 21758 TaxID=1121302 RepID=A0A1M6PKV6_9CLOT|nr:transcriptional regulator, PadR family [Clostridium cavendishii DSM 21758]
MDISKLIKSYLPMSETMYYILLSTVEKRHGYGIILYVEEITNKRIKLGAGTIYNTLSKLEGDSLVKVVEETDRKKIYKITDLGKEILAKEIERLNELTANSKYFLV